MAESLVPRLVPWRVRFSWTELSADDPHADMWDASMAINEMDMALGSQDLEHNLTLDTATMNLRIDNGQIGAQMAITSDDAWVERMNMTMHVGGGQLANMEMTASGKGQSPGKGKSKGVAERASPYSKGSGKGRTPTSPRISSSDASGSADVGTGTGSLG